MENKNAGKLDEVTTTEDNKQYVSFLLDGFKIRTGDEALESFREKLSNKADAEQKMLAWVQGKMRLSDPKKPAKEGEFDKAASRFLAHIFKEEMKDARKQTKLTDGFITTSIMGVYTKKQAAKIAEVVIKNMENQAEKFAFKRSDTRCQVCHRPQNKHTDKTPHKFKAAMRGRGRPKQK